MQNISSETISLESEIIRQSFNFLALGDSLKKNLSKKKAVVNGKCQKKSFEQKNVSNFLGDKNRIFFKKYVPFLYKRVKKKNI